jgi:hypothetical protein
MVRASNGEEMSPRPLEKTPGTDQGLEARQGGFDRQLSEIEHKAQAAVDLLRTKRLLSTVGEYEVQTTLTIGRVVRYRCSVRRNGKERGSGFSPVVVDRTPHLSTGTVMPDASRVVFALEAVEVHFARCADISARAAQPPPRPYRATLVAVAIMMLTSLLAVYARWRSPMASSISTAVGLLLASVGSFVLSAYFNLSPRAKNTLILFDREFRVRESALMVCLVGCLLVVFPLVRIAVMHQQETPEHEGRPISQGTTDLPTEEGQSVARQQNGTDAHSESQGSQATEPFSLTGRWTITNTVLETSYKPYQNVRLGFQLLIHQHGDEFTGNGEKYRENGQKIPGSARRPISITGTIADGSVIDATFQEEGLARQIQGRFTLTMRNRNHLSGTFVATAAKARGVSQWIRAE